MPNWYTELKRKSRGKEVGIGMGLGAPLAGAMLMYGLYNTPNGEPPKKPERPAATQPATRPTTSPSSIGQPATQPATRPATQPAATTRPTGKPNITVARIIFSEAAGVSPKERALVAGVIRNRVGNKAFGGAKDMTGVVTQRNAFEALNDDDNKNWAKSADPANFNTKEQSIWQECLSLSSGAIPEAKGPSGQPLVYYHDKSITKPKSWDNRFWRAVKEVETPHFIFYSVVPANQP